MIECACGRGMPVPRMTSRKKKAPIKGARAVMASRKERKDSLDPFWTPPWAARSLLAVILPHIDTWITGPIWEPACGEGHISEALFLAGYSVYSSDIHHYGYRGQGWTADFFRTEKVDIDWIITNPPFSGKTDRALEFTLKALELARIGVAMFVRTQWATEGKQRYERLFRDNPPTLFAPFTERVNLCRGRWDPDGSTATAYCWLVWIKGRDPMPPFWIPPGQRQALTRPDDRERFAAWSIPHASAGAEQEAAE